MSGLKQQKNILIKHQSGQTMVFALVFIVVILIGVIILFNTGQLTRHKMEVQNAADAAAYSAAILTARELNFMAYTNRAMVANQVSVGQFSAFRSWSQKYVMGATRKAYAGYAFLESLNVLGFGVVPVGSIIAGAVQGILVGYDFVNRVLVGSIMNGIANVATNNLPRLQKFYLRHQYIMQAATHVSQVEILPKVIDANAKGATLSNFGALAALFSATEQQLGFLSVGNNKGTATRRFAAFVNDSRDDWTKDRDRPDLRPSLPDIPLPGGEIKFNLGFEVLGGTELRIIKKGKKELYDWTSLDTVGLGFGVHVRTSFCAFYGFTHGPHYHSIKNPFHTTFGCIFRPKIDVPVNANLPFGGASHELASGAQLGPNIASWGTVESDLYGQSLKKNYLASIEAVTLGRQPSKKFRGLPQYIDIDADNYPAINEAPIFLVSVRKNANELHTSDRINTKNEKLTEGNFDVETKLSGGDNTAEGDPIASKLRSYSAEVVDRYKNKYKDNNSDIGSGFAEAAAKVFERELDNILNNIGEDLERILIPDSENQQSGAIFAIAAARVYFKNPDEPNEKGSTFTPYWQVRLEPVDDDIRRWSVISQGLNQLNAVDSLDDDNHLDRLSEMVK